MKVIVCGGIAWLSVEEAIRAVENANSAGAPILGFDAALIEGDRTRPSLEDSWDYTSSAYPRVDDRYAHAIEFIRARSKKALSFDIVLADTGEKP